MKLLISIFFATTMFMLILNSCKVSEKAIPGVYTAGSSNQYQLKLYRDRNFELDIVAPITPHDHLTPETKILVSGTWKIERNTLQLFQPDPSNVDDSITRFTNISSFNFWDVNGNPVPIRYILVPTSKLKPHFGNSLYFFAQDFNPSDTLTFYFEDYPPFKFPGSVPATIGNNIHKITMQEPYRIRIPGVKFTIRKNELFLRAKELQNGTTLKRKEKVFIQKESYP